MREGKIIGAVDIGGTKIAVGAVTEEGEIITRLECATAPAEGFALCNSANQRHASRGCSQRRSRTCGCRCRLPRAARSVHRDRRVT